MNSQRQTALSAHLVGGGEQSVGDRETERLRCLEVDDQFELVHLFDRQVGWRCPLQNSADVMTAPVIAVAENRPIAHETTSFDKFTEFINRRHCISCCERDKALTFASEQRIGADEQRVGALLGEAWENLSEVVFGGRF